MFHTSSATQVSLLVRDHGPGVPLADQEQIVQRFVRASSAASGSGLAVVKLLMERMGG